MAGLVRPAARPSPTSRAAPSGQKSLLKGRPIAGVTLLLVGVALLLISLFVGWYVVSETSSETVGGSTYTVNASETVYLLNQQTLSFSCQGSSSCFQSGTSTGTYSQGSLTSLGGLYDTASGLVVCGAIFAAAAAFFALTGGRRRSGWVTGFALVGLLLLLLAPTLVAVAQPSVLQSQGTITGSASPSHSFFGSCSGSPCGASVAPGDPISGSWGPSVGWYLSLVAIVFLLAGLFSIRGHRRALAGAITPDMLQ